MTAITTKSSMSVNPLRKEIRKKAKKMRDTPMGELEEAYAKFKFIADITYSEKKAAELFSRLVKNSTWVCPTLTVRFEKLFRNEQNIVNDPRLKYLPLSTRDRWKHNVRVATATGEIRDSLKKFFEKNFAIVGAMNDAGVGLLAGTDTFMSGLDLQDELVLFVQAGLSPMEALQTATYNAAKCLGLLDSMGTIERGKVADLVLLDSNPLQDISNTRRIVAVVVGGKIFDKTALQKMLAQVEALEHLHEDRKIAELVKLRYFVGLTVEQAADILKINRRTAYRYSPNQ